MIPRESRDEGENTYVGCEHYLKQLQVWGLIKLGNFWCKKVVSPTLLQRYFTISFAISYPRITPTMNSCREATAFPPGVMVG